MAFGEIPAVYVWLRLRRALVFPWLLLWLWAVIGELSAGAAVLAQSNASARVQMPARPLGTNAAELARVYCGACHLFPEPALLDKKTWKEQTLPRMKIRMGLDPEKVETHREAALLKATGVYATEPLIATQDFQRIVDYYADQAPETALPQDPRPEIEIGLRHFKTEIPKFSLPVPSTTLLRVRPAARGIYLGDADTQSLYLLDSRGSLVERIKLGNVPISLGEEDGGLYLALIGHFSPSEDPRGGLIYLKRAGESFQLSSVLLTNTPRASDVTFADLNGDGKKDFVLCLFGNNVGRLSWFENLGKERYQEHVLITKPGAVRAVVHDFNGDGFPDLATLIAQDTESLFILTNDGRGSFTSRTVFQKHPLFGHTYFELADLNADGKMDFLVTNGDNGEYVSPTKKYHGIRIYQNAGNQRFEEKFFFPMNGAFKAVARDFDGDGDLDIAAISFFPDYQKSPQESFIYLENKNRRQFVPSTLTECVAGRWLTMDVGDLDADGDLDIVLGSYIYGPSEVPGFLMEAWEKNQFPLVILRNQLQK